MKKIFLNLLLSALAWLSCIGSIAAQNIVRAEYYLDADPGFGSGTSIAITPGTTVDQNFTIDVSLIPLGFHTLFVRSKDENGKWSMPMARPFYKDVIPAGTTPNLVQAEYYLDADPGFGSGISIAITPGTMVDQNFIIDVSLIPLGFHTLFVRSKDENGKWSMPMARSFYKDVIPTGTTPNLVQAEYYLDADPGFGSGTSIAITSGTTIDQNFTIDVSAIPLGFHTLFVRSKDENGKWSMPMARPFYKDVIPAGTTPNLVQAEYYLDADPGFGSGTSIAITPGTTVDQNFTIDVSAIPLGLHTLFVRTKDASGRWSSPFAASFTKTAPLPPTITSFSPESGPIGTTITITGTNFSTTPANNIVYFGATRATVTAATATQLTVTVPTGATYQPITVQVSGLTGFSSKPFVVTFPGGGNIDQCSFGLRIDVANLGGLVSGAGAVTDVDGDGKSDLLVSNRTNRTFSVYRNISAVGTISPSSFEPNIDFSTGSGGGSPGPVSIVAGDLDSDGKPDIAVLNYSLGTISVFKNLSTPGSINLQSRVDFPVGSYTWTLKLYDIDGDGKLDLVMTSYFEGVSILRNTSVIGTIDASSFANRINFPTGANPASFSVGDLDGDGKSDIAVPNQQSNTLSIFRNTSTPGTISLAPQVTFPTGSNPGETSLSDFDGDGKPDLAVPNQGGSFSITFFRNTSSVGAFSFSSFEYSTPGLAHYLSSLGDLDGDGKIDIAVANAGANSASILKNISTSGNIAFVTAAQYTLSVPVGYAFDIHIADIDGDGKHDLVTTSDGLSIFKNIIGEILPPTITSFTPSSGSIGSSVTITGTNFSTTLADNIVKFNGVAATVTASTATSITTTVPTGATTGTISVQVGCNTVTSSTSFTALPHAPLGNTVTLNGTTDYIYVADNASLKPPSITVEAWVKVNGFTSTKGGGNPQYQAIIFKRNTRTTFYDSYTISLDEANKKFQVAVNSSSGTYIEQVTPNNSVVLNQWYHIALTANSTELRMYVNGTQVGSAVATGFPLDYDTTPLVIGRTNEPYEGFFNGAEDEVRIWNTIRTQSEIQSTMNSTLIGNEPGLAAYYKMDETGQGAGITVANSATATGAVLNGTTFGTACTPIFTLTSPPAITSFSPASGPIGTSVTITGTNFSTTPANNIVKFNGVTATVTASTATSITTSIPTGATTGTISVQVGCNTVTSGSNFTVPIPPTITSFSPASAAIGSTVTITGTNFSTTPTDNIVNFNGIAAIVTASTTTSITTTVPAGATTGTISIQVGANSAVSASSFIVSNLSWIDWISGTPGAASTAAGVFNTPDGQVNVNYSGEIAFIQTGAGTNYFSPSGPFVSAIVSNPPPAAEMIALSQSTNKILTFSKPVDNLFFAVISLNGNGYKFDNDFVIVSQGAGYWGSGTLTKQDLGNGQYQLNGTGEPHGVIQFIGAVSSLSWTSLSNEFWNGFTIGTLGIADSPTISALAPLCGFAGTVVTLTGTNFDPTPANNIVKFNGVTAVVTASTATTITTTVPTGATTGPITVQLGSNVGTSSNFFIGVPSFTSFTPASGPVGEVVTITGTNLTGATAVSFNGTAATTFTVVSSTSITATVPTGATTGLIDVTVGCNTVTSGSNFVVNQLPTSANASVSTAEDVNVTFAVANFPFTDDGTFAGIEITSFETVGDLEYNGVDVTLNQLCADVTLLVFKPALNANGSPYGSYGFKVRDNGGATSAVAYTMTLNVTPVNDPPVITAQLALSTLPATARTILIGEVTVADPDNTVFTLAVQDGINYTRVGNTITPDVGFIGLLSVPVTVNDGTVNSSIFNLNVCVNPSPPMGVPGQRCGSGSVSLSASGATGLQQYRWYGAATGGSVLASTAVFVTPALNTTTSYYVSIVDQASCGSARTEVIATVKPGPQISFTNATGYTASYVSPAQGADDALFEFRIIYTDAGGNLPSAGYPRVELDANGNNQATDPLDIIRVMQEVATTDIDVTDGKEYRVTITNLSETINWRSRIVTQNVDGCAAQTSFISSPFVSNDLLDVAIFANDISFSKSNPAINEPIRMYARIKNTSDYLAENFVVSAYIKDVQVFTQSVAQLNPQSSITLQWDQSFVASGFYPVKIVLDETNVLAEDNELNNFAIRPVLVGDYVLPGGIDVGASSIAPVTLQVSQPITISGKAEYFGIDPSVDPDVAGATVIARITGGGQVQTTTRADGTYQLSISAPSIPGTYLLNMEATDYTLTGYQGPITITVLPAPPLPDLTTTITLSKNTILPGEPVTGIATVYNNGDVTATNFVFRYVNCEQVLGEHTIASLAPGESLTYTFNATTNSIGDCFNANSCSFQSYVDVLNQVIEKTEANNTSSTSLSVRPNKPDLTPINGTNQSIPGSVNMLNPFTFTVRVDNIGGVDATTPFNVNVYVDGVLIRTQPITSLGTCAGTSFQVNHTFADVNDHTITIRVDEPIGTGSVDEYRETNNEYSKTIQPSAPLPPSPPNLNVRLQDISITPALPPVSTNFDMQVAYRNNGPVTLTAPFNIELSVVEAGVTRSELQTVTTNMAAGAVRTATLTTNLQTNGDHLFRVRLDPENVKVESTKSDNVTQISLCTDINVAPQGGAWNSNFYVNSVQNLTASISNLGIFTATNVPISFFLDNVKIATTSVATLGPVNNAVAQSVSIPHLFAQAGTFELKVMVDELNAYTECREDNNEYKATITVRVPAPDVRIVSEYISPSKINPDVNEPITIFLSYDNIGIGATGAFKARVLVDNVAIGPDITLASVPSGQDGTVQVPTAYQSNTAGIRVIRTILDPDNELTETSKTNNEATRSLVVGQAPNLYFTNLQSGVACPNNGDDVIVTASITNAGDLEATASVLFFYITPSDTIPIESKTITVFGKESITVQTNWLVLDKTYSLYAEIRDSSPEEFDKSDNSITTKLCGGPYFNLIVTTEGQGIIQKNPNQQRYEGVQQVEATAVPAAGWNFAGWQGDIVSLNNPLIIDLSSDRQVVAIFTEVVSAPTTTAVSRCEPGEVILQASGAMGAQTYAWYGNATGGTPLQNTSSNTFTTPSLASTTSYFVSIRSFASESPRVEVTATILALPTMPTTTSAANCGAGSITISASGGTNGRYRWYTTATGGAAIPGEVNSTYTTPTLSATTDYYVSINNGSCESTRTQVTATIGSQAAPTSPTNASSCSAGSVTLSVSGGTNGQYRWYTTATVGTAIPGEVNSTYTTPTLSATTDYYVSINNGSCESTRTQVTATIGSQAAPTSPTNASSCSAGSVTLSVSGGTNGQYRWYTTATGGAAIPGEVNSTYTTPTLSATTNYYVSINNGSCESTRTQVTATIGSQAAPTSPTNASSCSAGSVTLSVSGGTNGQYRWYTTATGGAAIPGEVNSTYTTPTLSATTNYYVSINNGSCESTRTQVTATIGSQAAPTSPTNASSCSAGSVTLSVSGGTNGQYRWYTTATVGTAIPGEVNSTYTTPTLSATTNYYVSINNGSCESTRTQVTATIGSQAAPTSPTNASSCSAGSVTLSVSGGTNGQYRWYTTATGGAAIPGEVNSTYTTPTLSATTNYYVSINNGSCESTRTQVTATIGSQAAPTSPTNASSCSAGSVTLSVSGGTNGQYRWYTTATGGAAIPGEVNSTYTTPTLSATTDYYVSINNGSCESTRTQVTATIGSQAAPTSPINASSCSAGSVTLSVSGGTNGQYRWYTTATGGAAIPGEVNSTYTTPTLSATTNYYVSINNGSCESTRTQVTATIGSQAAPTSPTNASSCSAGSVTLSVSGGTNGQYRWYTTATGGTAIPGEVNSTYTTPTLSATTDYYVSINNGSCESTRTQVTATINSSPSAPQANASAVCSGVAATITATGGTNGQYRWYTVAVGGTSITGQVNNTFITPPLNIVTTYYVAINNGVCESPRTSVTITLQTSGCAGTIVIAPVAINVQQETVASINILKQITTSINNLDISTIKITTPPASGAKAVLDADFNLIVDYRGVSFVGLDKLSIIACTTEKVCATEEFTIQVEGDFIVFNAVSPNNDNKNETFFLQNINLLPEFQKNKVTIFNRWGDIVFEVKDYDNTTRVFRGLNNSGEALPSGTYFYKIVFESGVEEKTGFIAVRK